MNGRAVADVHDIEAQLDGRHDYGFDHGVDRADRAVAGSPRDPGVANPHPIRCPARFQRLEMIDAGHRVRIRERPVPRCKELIPIRCRPATVQIGVNFMEGPERSSPQQRLGGIRFGKLSRHHGNSMTDSMASESTLAFSDHVVTGHLQLIAQPTLTPRASMPLRLTMQASKCSIPRLSNKQDSPAGTIDTGKKTSNK